MPQILKQSYSKKLQIDNGESKNSAQGKPTEQSNNGSGSNKTVNITIIVCGIIIIASLLAVWSTNSTEITPASAWAGSYMTAGCDSAKCCCAHNLNVREVGPMKVVISGKLEGSCQKGVSELAITKSLMNEGTIIRHKVLNFTVTYELRDRAIVWYNNVAAQCNGYAYPSNIISEQDRLAATFYKRKSTLWIGTYSPSFPSKIKNKKCCIPELISISQAQSDFGLKISFTKKIAGTNNSGGACNFRNKGSNLHTLSTLVPRGSDMDVVADGIPFRLSHSGNSLTLNDMDSKECDLVTYKRD